PISSAPVRYGRPSIESSPNATIRDSAPVLVSISERWFIEEFMPALVTNSDKQALSFRTEKTSGCRLNPELSVLPDGAVLQGRYRIVRQLGKGGMGAVYEAVDQRLDATVALKETFSVDDRLRRQFEQ